MTNQCPYCDKVFARESSVAKHTCERKRRFLSKDEPSSRLGFMSFLQFWDMHHRSSKQTIDTFIRSPYYMGFKKFGGYCVDIKALNPESFVRWLLKNNHALDRWCRDTLYNEWMIEYLKREAVTDALARSVETSIQWSADTDMQAADFIRYANSSRLIHAVSTGRLSPWAIYCSNSGQEWLGKLGPEELKLIWSYIDAGEWNNILLERAEDRLYAMNILERGGW